ncbi:hypothetical protein QO010_000098 [Caulobacter ginsengisoli]|uniref:Uncharacterized protein n=1 Tax=Caulobacter ginsengisoli TaxID=400775 RepID=A0ABU0IK16_9CAUL|nr:hypothetical protein [Caulobacter ginsengisoli]MDQ0462350.1 hypothetical protein [Caulobacter ginsengisoli]
MRFLRSLAAAAAALLLCGPAMAAGPSDADARENAAARAVADATISRLGVGGYFENVSYDDRPMLRHKGSGMICIVDDDSKDFSITLGRADAPADDVTCAGASFGADFSRAYKSARPLDIDEAMQAAVQALRTQIEDLKTEGGPPRSAREPVSGTPVAFAFFTGRRAGKTVTVSVGVFVIGDWTYVQEFISPDETVKTLAILAGAWMELGLLEMRKFDAR